MYRRLFSDKKIYDVLDLIAKGDAVELLSEENLTDCFNELLENDLISITEGEVQLTEKGRMAQSGREKFVLEPHEQDETIYFSEASRKTSRRIFNLSLYFLLLCLAGFFVVFVIG